MRNEYMIDEIAGLICKKLNIRDGEAEQGVITKALHEYWKGKMVCIWCADDVKETARDMRIRLSGKEVEQVLDNMHKHHDAEYGVNWETIRSYIDDIAYDRKEKATKKKKGR